jgi:2-amino-4-hydroxy-6-hydroxymethyldihydropteridine diphosphokinase
MKVSDRRRGGEAKAPRRRMFAYIGLGANKGDRRTNILRALEMLEAMGIRPVAISRLIETHPVGGPPGQPMFLNGAAKVETRLTPRELLDALMEVERRLGRDRREEIRNGPRPIDLDLLLYGSEIIRESELTVPHPRMHERFFVLGPLSEIAPRVRHPVLRRTVASLAEDCRRNERGKF